MAVFVTDYVAEPTTEEDWQSTVWEVTMGQMVYFPVGSTIEIDASLNVTGTSSVSSESGEPVTVSKQVTFNEGNGTLTWQGEAGQDSVSATGAVVTEGTQVIMVMSMVRFTNSEGEKENHLTILALYDDPEESAVIAAVER